MASAPTSPDNFYRPFVERVRASVHQPTDTDEALRLLDGAAADEVHSRVPRTIRSKDGIFFSGHALAQETAKLAKDSISNGASIFDPACGAGDLLLAAAKLLPIQKTLNETLHSWGEILGGTDLHQAFVDATKWRLILLAKYRHGQHLDTKKIDFEGIFPGISKLDYFTNPEISDPYDCILVNPPFGHRKAPENCSWSTGRTQLAALFLDTVLKHRKVGQIVVAVLPDVLRGGTRYRKWREMVEGSAKVTATRIYGRFEKRTDVDVFISRYERAINIAASQPPISPVNELKATVSDVFAIAVGAVVPHRHVGKTGNWRPYLTVANAPKDSEIAVTNKRRFDGKCVQPPFVAIRRTSNPSDLQRIVCTIVTGTDLVAVENHLLTLVPHSGEISACRRLVKHLNSQLATDHVNDQLRCRHLTTTALKSLPLTGW